MRDAALLRQAFVVSARLVAADDKQKRIAREARQSDDRHRDPLAHVPGVGEEYRRGLRHAQLAAHRRAMLSQLRREDVAVDRVVDHVKLLFGDAEAVANLVADHLGAAYHGAQRPAREEPPLDLQDITVVRAPFDCAADERRLVAQALLEPDLMYAVARAIDVAAQEPFVRLHQLRGLLGNLAADGSGKAPVAPETADVGRIANHRLDQLQPCLRPPAGVERDRDPTLEQCLQRGLDVAFGDTRGSITLADDREPHGTPALVKPGMRNATVVSMAADGAFFIRGRYQSALLVTNAASQGLLVDKVARLLCLRTIG